MTVDLAGHDVVVQLHAETVSDAASLPFENIPGQTAFVLGGPFLIAPMLPADGAFPGAVFHAVVEVRLRPRTGDQDRVRLAVTLRDGVLVPNGLPASIAGLACSAEVMLPLGLRYLPGLQADGTWPADKSQQEATGTVFPDQYATGLFADFANATVAFAFEGDTRERLVAATSQQAVAALQGVLSAALEARLATAAQDAVPLGFGALRVRPGVASADLGQLADWPVLRWLSPTTVAIFGHYGLDDSHRDPARKDGRSDIDAKPLKFLYPGSQGNLTAIPARCAALSLSTRAMRRLGFCPALRDSLARASVIEQKTPEIERALGNREREYSPAEQAAYYETLLREGKTKGIREAMALALHAAAKAGAAEWTDSPAAASALTAATPPECGTGEAKFPVPVPVWFDGEVVVTRTRFTPGHGHIVTELKASAGVPPGVGVDATARIVTRLSIGQGGQRIVATHSDPEVTTDGTGAAVIGLLVGFLTAPFGGVAWGVILGTTSAIVFEEAVAAFGPGLVLSEASEFLGDLPTGQQVPLPSQPPVRLDDITIDPGGMTIFGLVGRALRWNDASSRVDLGATRIARAPDPGVPTTRGTYRKPVSCQDGLPREFTYRVTGWKETWLLRVESHNVPGPLRFEDVVVELGDESVRSTPNGLLEPHWLAPTPLAVPQTSVPGPATVFEDPAGPRVREHVTVAVTDLGAGQWEIGTRGVDGCYTLRVSLACIDARGTRHALSALLFPDGLVLEWEDAMAEETRACIAKAKRELEQVPPIVEMQDIPPWAEVWDPVPWKERGRIQRALVARDLASLSVLDERVVQRELAAGRRLLSRRGT